MKTIINKIELIPNTNKHFPHNWVANVTKGELITDIIVGSKPEFANEFSVRAYLEHCFDATKSQLKRMNDSITKEPSICLVKNH